MDEDRVRAALEHVARRVDPSSREWGDLEQRLEEPQQPSRSRWGALAVAVVVGAAGIGLGIAALGSLSEKGSPRPRGSAAAGNCPSPNPAPWSEIGGAHDADLQDFAPQLVEVFRTATAERFAGSWFALAKGREQLVLAAVDISDADREAVNDWLRIHSKSEELVSVQQVDRSRDELVQIQNAVLGVLGSERLEGSATVTIRSDLSAVLVTIPTNTPTEFVENLKNSGPPCSVLIEYADQSASALSR
jgi:hypothetical protein